MMKLGLTFGVAILLAIGVLIASQSIGTSYTTNAGDRVTIGNTAEAHPDARCDWKTRVHWRWTWSYGWVKHVTDAKYDYVYNGRYYIVYNYKVWDSRYGPDRYLGGYEFRKTCALQSAYA